MSNIDEKNLTIEQQEYLLTTLKSRFENNMNRHANLEWDKIQVRLNSNITKLWSLHEMENTGGEPDIVGLDPITGEYILMDCSPESPKSRRNVCYDRQAQESRREFSPDNNAIDMATSIGIELLTEEQYRGLQNIGDFDTKTSSWLKTPDEIRKLGGALFGDCRFGRVFIYHNGAESYYKARGFRGLLRV